MTLLFSLFIFVSFVVALNFPWSPSVRTSFEFFSCLLQFVPHSLTLEFAFWTGVYVQFVDKDYYILNNNAKELLDKDGKHKEAAEKLNTSKPIFFTESLSGSNKRYLPEDQWKDYPEHVTKKAKIETTTTTTTTTTIADETTPTTNDANAPTTTTVATEIIPDPICVIRSKARGLAPQDVSLSACATHARYQQATWWADYHVWEYVGIPKMATGSSKSTERLDHCRT